MAAEEAALGAFANAGQICTSVERIYVTEAVADEFLESLVRRAGELVMGPGLDPLTQLGPLVDDRLRTSVANIYAAGDIARAEHPILGGTVRVEHWGTALEQGPVAARNMLGQDIAYDRIPYFFSDQYDVGMEYAGHALSYDRVVFRGDPSTFEFMAFWMRGDRVAAGINVNVWDVNEDIQALVRSGASVDDEALRNPDVALGGLIGAGR